VTVTLDLQVQALGEGIDDRDAHSVQATGDLVAVSVAELAAGVQGGEHHLRGRPFLLGVHVDGDPAPVVCDGAAVVGVQDHADAVAMARERLVDRVVDHLVDEVVKPTRASRADVHPGALANRLQPLEDGDVLGAVGGSLGFLPLAGALRLLRQLVPSRSHRKPRSAAHVPQGSGRNAN